MTFAAADDASLSQAAPVMLDSAGITFEYISTVYNGKEQRPALKVVSGGSILVENTDFTVTYPKDCVNAGKKTVNIKGIGGYTGSFSATYMIEPLDCSEGSESSVNISIAECSYSGMPLMPDVTVKVNGMTLDDSDYKLTYSDNINVTTAEDKAKCAITFRGNYSGKRAVVFDIKKTPSDDIDIRYMVHPGDHIVYDLTPLKPEGAVFGAIKYYAWDFVTEHQPKIAFNELSFTVPDNIYNATAIVIPVLNAPNREDYNIVVYPTPTAKPIPTLVINSPDREYNGEPLSADIFSKNGSYAMVDGKIIDGTWDFWDEPPMLPCDKLPCVVTFNPTDTQYSSFDTVVYVTISRLSTESFTIKPHRTELALGQTGQLVISGIPEDYRGEVTLSYNGENDIIDIVENIYNGTTKKEYEIDFPIRSGRYTFTAQLSGDGIYLPNISQCSITVGDYVSPEDKPSDNVTTAAQLEEMISSAAEGSIVRAEGIRTIPSQLMKAAYSKRLILQIKLNDAYTWIIDTSKLPEQASERTLDLDISTAVIPAVLLDKIGGDNLCSFNVYANDLGDSSELCVSSGHNNSKKLFANLFLYSTTGELKFISCTPLENDGTARFDIKASGKYAVMLDTETKLAGDMNNSCKTELSDVSNLLKEYVSLPSGTEPVGKYFKYDVDGDGALTIGDVSTLLKKYIFGY